MAVLKSDIVTAIDDKDTMVDQGIHRKDGFTALYDAAGAMSNNDVILMGVIPVDAKIKSIKITSDDLGTTGDFNVGFYPGPSSNVTVASDADAVDEDAIGTAVDVNAAALAGVELRFETKDLETINQKAFELAGLSARPDYGDFFLAITLSEATTAGGEVVLDVELAQA